jgi:hypothetical protein
MPTDTLTKQIEDKMLELEELAKKGELARCILAELEVNRLLHERTILILEDLGVKLDKMLKNDTNLKKIYQKLSILTEKKSFLGLIKDNFKK